MVAIVLVLCAVFIPVAFLGGIAGQLYRQFAVTLTFAVVISGFMALTLTPALCALLMKKEAERYGNAHVSIVPYQVFHASDRAFAVGAGTDRHFAQLSARVLGRPELADDRRFATNEARVKNRKALIALLEKEFKSRRASQWIARCKKAAIPASLVRGVREALRSPEGRALVETVEHPEIGRYEAVRNPVRIGGQRRPPSSPPPRLGEHTEMILRELTERDEQKHGAAEKDEGDHAAD